MPTLYLVEDVPCKVCGKGVLKIGTRPVSTAEEAKAWGEREFRRRRADLPLALKARTCSAACYMALPSWRRLVARFLPVLARPFLS